MKTNKNNILEDYLINFRKENPILSKWINLKVRLSLIFINIKHKF